MGLACWDWKIWEGLAHKFHVKLFLCFCCKSCPYLGRWLNANRNGQFVIATWHIVSHTWICSWMIGSLARLSANCTFTRSNSLCSSLFSASSVVSAVVCPLAICRWLSRSFCRDSASLTLCSKSVCKVSLSDLAASSARFSFLFSVILVPIWLTQTKYKTLFNVYLSNDSDYMTVLYLIVTLGDRYLILSFTDSTDSNFTEIGKIKSAERGFFFLSSKFYRIITSFNFFWRKISHIQNGGYLSTQEISCLFYFAPQFLQNLWLLNY